MGVESASGLVFKAPTGRTIVLALMLAVSFHIFIWFVVQSIMGLESSEALSVAQTQGLLSLSWLIAGLCLWALWPPKTRFRAMLSLLGAAAFITLMGSLVGLLRLGWGQAAKPVLTFALFSVAMSIAHIALALPSAFIFQAFCLESPKSPDQP